MIANSLALCLLAMSLLLQNSPSTQENAEKAKVVSAEEFRLVDKDGKLCGMISLLGDGTIGITGFRQYSLLENYLKKTAAKPEVIEDRTATHPFFEDISFGFRAGMMKMGKFDNADFVETYLAFPIDDQWFGQFRLGETSTKLDKAEQVSIGRLQSTYLTAGIGYDFAMSSDKMGKAHDTGIHIRPNVFGIIQHNDFQVDGAVSGLLENALGLSGYQESINSSFGFGIGTEINMQLSPRVEAGLDLRYTWMKADVEISTFDLSGPTLVTGFDAGKEKLGGLAIGLSFGVRF